jgi:hypothetical protein
MKNTELLSVKDISFKLKVIKCHVKLLHCGFQWAMYLFDTTSSAYSQLFASIFAPPLPPSSRSLYLVFS